MTDRGVLYVATKLDRYIEEAFLSAESVKRKAPGLPIVLFTDRPDHPLCDTACFDTIESVETATGYASSWAAGLLDRLRCLLRSPFEQTLHIDTDTRIFADELPTLFALLNDIDVGMVPTAVDDSFSRRLYGKPMFNGGLILYRKNEKTRTWLSEWIALSERYFRIAGEHPLPAVPELAHVEDESRRRELLSNDQTSLAQILSPDVNRLDLAVKSLSYAWNYRHSRLPENNLEPIKILHSPALKLTTHADILAVAYDWTQNGYAEDASPLYDYIAGKQLAGLPATKGFWPWSKTIVSPPEQWASPRLRDADLHLRFGQGDKAIELFGAELAANADNAYALCGHARVALRLDRTENALALAEQAVALHPASAHTQFVYGMALIAAGRHAEAVAALERASKRGEPAAAFQLGQAWFGLAEYRKAAQTYRRALVLNSEHNAARNNLMPALLGQRDYEAVVEVADQALTKRAWHVPALAFKSIALAELGRHDEERELADLDRFTDIERLQPPPGYASLDEFNGALANVLAAERSLRREPREHATRFGWHSEDLSDAATPELTALHDLILRAVERRMAKATGDAHPFARACPQSYRLHSWTVIMEEGGHQIPHIHAKGWLSGVYYVEVPEAVAANDPDRSGWLALGRGEEQWHRPTTKTVEKFVHPEPGLLVTFPSFFWHGTRPLRDSGRRISFAFDVIPL